MGWNVSAEFIAFIIVLIISVYSRRSHAVPSQKNRLFQICLATTLGAIGTNLASTLMIAYAPQEIAPLTWLVTMCYFVLTPLLGTVYFYYAVAVVGEARPIGRRFLALTALPCVLYLGCVVANVPTGCLFTLVDGVYRQGPLISTTYIVFYFYCLACFVLVVFTRAPIDPVIKRILAVYPLIAVVVIAAQQMFPSYLLSGSAAACSLLIIYLYLQNKRLSVDSLTGVPNRQEFSSMIALMHGKQRAFTAVLVSLSNFKFINDKFGHESGDQFLREFTRFLESQSKGMRLYRYSGDQFALLVDEGDTTAKADTACQPAIANLLESLRSRLQHAWDIAGHSYKVSASIGVVSYPAIAQNPGDVVAALEYTTSQAKQWGPNMSCICIPAMIDVIHRRSAVVNIVREAVQRDAFTVHYQPVWSEQANHFIAAEALCRLTDDELGAIGPDEFIPIAEQTGFISDVTFQVLEQACAFMADYRAVHPDSPFRGVSVNFSAVQFIQNDLAEMVIDVVNRHNIPASCLCIEITESAIIANPDVARSFMSTMHDNGVLFYLDDFGTGYSSLSSLLELPFDVIKVDKSILWSATANGGEAEFLGHLASCFDSIGPKMLAEGVETQAQRSYLNRCGCDLMQGYLLSRPLPPDEAAAVIAASELARR